MSYTESTLKVGLIMHASTMPFTTDIITEKNGHDNRNYDIQVEEQGTTLDNKTTHLSN